MLKFLLPVLAVLAALLTSMASAAETERVGSFLLVDGAPELIILVGDITPQTPLDFRTALSRRPDAKLVVLASDGGVVSSGLLLADDVHLRGLNTYIPAQSRCYSACAYIFLAGKSRLAEGELGVHQFYGGNDTAEGAQMAMSDVLDILAKFDTPQPLISRMLRTKSDDMYVFTRDELAELSINREPGEALSQTLALRTLPEETFSFAPEEPEAVATAVPAAPVAPTVPISPVSTTGPRFALYAGVDFYGADVGKVRVKEGSQCLSACVQHKQCRAFTFNMNEALRTGPNCFLKDSMGRGEFYADALSGVFLFADESDTIRVGSRTVQPVSVIGND